MPADECEGCHVIRIVRGPTTLASGFPGVVGLVISTGAALLDALANEELETDDVARLER